MTENIGFAWSCEPSDGAHRDEHLYNKIITALDFYLTDPLEWWGTGMVSVWSEMQTCIWPS